MTEMVDAWSGPPGADDIVERLRHRVRFRRNRAATWEWKTADEIERLRAALREACDDLSSLIDLAHNAYDVNAWCAKLEKHTEAAKRAMGKLEIVHDE